MDNFRLQANRMPIEACVPPRVGFDTFPPPRKFTDHRIFPSTKFGPNAGPNGPVRGNYGSSCRCGRADLVKSGNSPENGSLTRSLPLWSPYWTTLDLSRLRRSIRKSSLRRFDLNTAKPSTSLFEVATSRRKTPTKVPHSLWRQ